MLAHSERVNGLTTIQLWLDLARSRPRTLLSHGAKPQAPDRSEEPLILRQPDEPLPLTPLCRDRADALRCPSSFHTIARRSLRARSHLRPPRLLTRPCRRGSLSRATRAPSVVRSAMRVAVRAFPSRACARVEWAWPVYGIRFRAGACSRCSPDRLPFEERIVDCSLDPVSPVSSAAEARSRARPAWDASGGDPGPFDRYLQPTRFVFNDEPDCLGVFRIVLPTRFGSRRFYAGGPLRRSVHCFSAGLRAAAFTPRHAARRASDVLSAFAASDRDEPRARIQRELRAEFRRAA